MTRHALARPARLGVAAATALVLGAAVVPQAGATTPTGSTRSTVAVSHASARTMPAVRPGTTSRTVKKLQRLLGVHPRSGWYGPLTRAAVRKFKSSHGLGPSSVFGKKAWRKLLAEHDGKSKRRARASRASRSGSRGGLVCPAPQARFGNDYGDPRSGHSHAGIDMLGRRGMPIYAVENGYVVREGRQSNGALRIVIQGTQTGAKYYYGHNSRHLVNGGERIRAGEVIALMGDTGSPGINHLHFEWWRSGGESAHVNPYSLLRRIC